MIDRIICYFWEEGASLSGVWRVYIVIVESGGEGVCVSILCSEGGYEVTVSEGWMRVGVRLVCVRGRVLHL